MSPFGAGWIRWGSFFVAGALLAGFIIVPTPLGAQETDESPSRSAIAPVTAADLEAVAARLPADPASAGMLLVEFILTGEPRVARAAVGELLRRSGIPLVSPDGALVAAPDGVVLKDAVVYAELVTELTDAVRSDTHYTPQEVVWLLADLGYPEEGEIEPGELLAALGDWGKGTDAPGESRVAGAAVRALAASRGHVLYPGADPDEVILDPLQTLLVVAHATSVELVPVEALVDAAGAHTTAFFGEGAAPFAGAEVCKDLITLLEALKGPRNYLDVATSNPLGEHLTDKVKDRVLSPRVNSALERFSKVKGRADLVASVLGVLLLLLGAEIELVHASGGTGQWQTHFGHQADEADKHMILEARTRFNSSLTGKRLECWSLAGIDLPRSDVMEGFTVKWSGDQHLGRIQEGGRYLTAVSGDSHKFQQGEVLGSSGVSRVEMRPPHEKFTPEPGSRELEGSVRITVKLDQASLPLNLSNIWDWKGATIDLALDALKRAGLPSASRVARVTYHGSDIFIAKGAADVFLFYLTLPIFVDIYSCTGPGGPWKGRGGFGNWNKEFLAFGLEWLSGQNIPSEFSMVNEQINFLVNSSAAEPQPFPVTAPDPFISGLMMLDLGWLDRNELVRPHNGSISRPAGTVALLLGGKSMPFANLTYPIKWVTEDARCPRMEYEY